jgi:hypothetical protein
MLRSVGYLVDVAVRGTKVRQRLSCRFPLVDGADELDAFRLQTLAGALDVVDEKPDDRPLGEVSVLGVRGAKTSALLPSASLKIANSPSS